MKAILVTGGAGYIGSHTCKALAHEGYIPVTFDSFLRLRYRCSGSFRCARIRWGIYAEPEEVFSE